MTEPMLLTEREVAEALRVSDRTVRRLIAAGRLRVVHPTPGRTLVTRRELLAYVASLEGRPPTVAPAPVDPAERRRTARERFNHRLRRTEVIAA